MLGSISVAMLVVEYRSIPQHTQCMMITSSLINTIDKQVDCVLWLWMSTCSMINCILIFSADLGTSLDERLLFWWPVAMLRYHHYIVLSYLLYSWQINWLIDWLTFCFTITLSYVPVNLITMATVGTEFLQSLVKHWTMGFAGVHGPLFADLHNMLTTRSSVAGPFFPTISWCPAHCISEWACYALSCVLVVHLGILSLV